MGRYILNFSSDPLVRILFTSADNAISEKEFWSCRTMPVCCDCRNVWRI